MLKKTNSKRFVKSVGLTPNLDLVKSVDLTPLLDFQFCSGLVR